MQHNLIDRYCASPHAAPITAAALDQGSGALVTADEVGAIAITRPGEAYPSILFEMGAPVHAVAVSAGGALVAVGDDAGTVGVYKTWDGSCVFEDLKEGTEGPARAVRALAFHPSGTILATVSADRLVRVYDLQRWDRLANFSGFGGQTIEFDATGELLLLVDVEAQPRLLRVATQESIVMDPVPGGTKVARFTPDGRHIIAMGQEGLTLIGFPDGQIRTSFAARGSSGMLTVVVSPRGDAIAAVTGRSVHTFSLPQLLPEGSDKHGAGQPTGAAVWDERGVAVAGVDGRMHRPGGLPSLEAVVCCTRFGKTRIAAHGRRLAVWEDTAQVATFAVDQRFVEVKIDRDAQLLMALPEEGAGVQVYDAKTGEHLFDAGPATVDTPKMEVGGSIVACMVGPVGLKWFDLGQSSVYELPWVQTFALSGSGSWLGVVTPRGQIRVLDARNGEEAMDKPSPPADDAPVRLLSFVNRRPELLALTASGTLLAYDLTRSAKVGGAAQPREILRLSVDVDRLWGLRGGHAAIRFQVPGVDGQPDTATVVYVDMLSCEVVSEVSGLLPYAWVDPESGDIVQPARGAAILERDMYGHDKRVLRALPEGEWVAFSPEGVLARSRGASV